MDVVTIKRHKFLLLNSILTIERTSSNDDTEVGW